ncbi:DUF4236 domain-containing protein [Speluncibacter jeojiensis]|uniref:DUF4236 domain-containing protein n=1 Tax=Speluncibacter jeojiensis TaxID=2710754 RepID=A0A9X4M159_9ACTN|nr:DUF4236 domain-containing protein [Corynebacteriales bacterium D3-21]
MGIGMSFKVAPGIRIRATSRGLRTSIGPRAARIHVGAGRPTVSTGAGPVTLWTPLTSSRRPAGRPRGQAASLAAYQRQAAADERAEQIAQVQQTENALRTLHREAFPAAQRMIVPPPRPPDLAALTARHTAAALAGISIFARTRRRDAKAAASAAAHAEADMLWQQACARQAEAQRQADAYWQALEANDPDTVHDALERAFEDNQWPATSVGHGTEDGVFASVAMLFGTAEMVPERKPALTPGGKPTLHKRTKTERNELYAEALGSTVLATVKEALAVAPGLSAVHVVVVRKDPQAGADKYLEVIYAGRFPRAWTDSLPWATLDPVETLLRAPDAKLTQRGTAHDIAGIDLSDEPGISEVLALMRSAL